jgi:hypothetical protein
LPGLGRIPSPPDSRDFVAENFLGLTQASAGTIDGAAVVAELKQTTVTYRQWAATTYPDVTQTHWWKAFNLLGQIAPPAPPPPGGDILWADPEVDLDQGQYGTCVGNGTAQFLNTNPVDDQYTEGVFGDGTAIGGFSVHTARALYYEATVFDGAPDNPDAPNGGQQGATVRSGMKALKARGRIGGYASAASLATVKTALAASPVVIGSDWTNDMFSPDSSGLVHPTGGVAGGHCYLLIGSHPSTGRLEFLNSWGASWGVGGHFFMTEADFDSLIFGQGGEAWVATELPL